MKFRICFAFMAILLFNNPVSTIAAEEIKTPKTIGNLTILDPYSKKELDCTIIGIQLSASSMPKARETLLDKDYSITLRLTDDIKKTYEDIRKANNSPIDDPVGEFTKTIGGQVMALTCGRTKYENKKIMQYYDIIISKKAYGGDSYPMFLVTISHEIAHIVIKRNCTINKHFGPTVAEEESMAYTIGPKAVRDYIASISDKLKIRDNGKDYEKFSKSLERCLQDQDAIQLLWQKIYTKEQTLKK